MINLEAIKYATCPQDGEEAVLIVNIDEDTPIADEDGQLQYYCPVSAHIFALHEEEDALSQS